MASVGSSSNANGVRLRDGGRPPPLTLSSNAVPALERIVHGEHDLGDPGGTFAAWKLIRNVPSGATHGLWPASANDGTAVCAPADGAKAATPATDEHHHREGDDVGAGSQGPPEDAQARGEVSKPNERYSASARSFASCVLTYTRSPPCFHTQAMPSADEGVAPAARTRGRVHCHPLEVAVPAGDAGDRVRDDRGRRHGPLGSGCWAWRRARP